MLATSVIGLGAVAASLAGRLKLFAVGGASYATAPPAAEVMRGAADNEFAAKVFDSATPVVTDAAPIAAKAAPAAVAMQEPYILLALAVVFAITAGACAGYLIKKTARL